VTLRIRLLLVTLAAALPLVAALVGFQAYFSTQVEARALSQFVRAHMQNGGRERCEANPEHWSLGRSGPPGGPPRPSQSAPRGRGEPGEGPRLAPPPPGPEGPLRESRPPPWFRTRLHAYGPGFSSENPESPALEPSQVRELKDVERDEVRRRVHGPGSRVTDEVLFRMPWGGPCAYVLAQRDVPPFELGWRRFVPPIPLLLIPVIAMLAGLFVAVGPLVQRIRQLTREVRASAKARYQPPLSIQGADEMGQLARAFEEAGREIHSRERSLRDFLDNTTHDVMIPLTVLQGHLTSIQGHVVAGRAVESSLVSAAMVEAHYMGSLIHNLAAVAQLESEEPALQRFPVDLSQLVERVVSRHAGIARRSEIALEHALPEVPLLVSGDLTLVEQAVSNVVYNAVRYNRAGGHVAVVLETVPGAGFVLRVIDDGPGIADEEMSRLSERHFRGSAARTRDVSGRGLGLNIALRVSALHGWRLVFTRSAHGGLQVEFTGPT